MQENYALFSKTRYIFLAKMPIAAANAPAGKQVAAGEAPAEIYFRQPFANAKGGDSRRVSLKSARKGVWIGYT